MRIRGALEKWASGVLGMVCVLLLVNLVWHKGVRAGSPKPTLPPPRAPEVRKIPTTPIGVKDDLSKYDSRINLDELKALQTRPMPEIDRNPFEYPAPPKPPPSSDVEKPVPPPPPPPPPITLKMIGFSEKAGGVKEAVVEDTDDIYVVHEGDIIAKKYQVTKITPVTIEVVDQTTRQSAQLPLATPANQ